MNQLKKYLIIILCLSVLSVFSRAGGGGGKKNTDSEKETSQTETSSWANSDHDKNDNHLENATSSLFDIPSWVFVSVGCVGFVLFVFIKNIENKQKQEERKQKQNSSTSSSKNTQSKLVIDNEFLDTNPGFDKQVFKNKVKTAFLGIQEAWTNQNLSNVRYWISDGIYQRFTIQFKMMHELGQKNIISNITIYSISFVKSNIEGNYSSITVSIKFKMDDQFISEKLPKLNQSFIDEVATEYWTFIKKSGTEKADLYHNTNCPNCGNNLSKNGGEVSKCPSCQTVTYFGDYDWILCEITQESDFEKHPELQNNHLLQAIYQEEDFSIQNMEDKASNAFVHYLYATAQHKQSHFARFATDSVINTMQQSITKPIIYNRFYMNSVNCSNYSQQENTHALDFDIRYTAQTVELSNNTIIEQTNSTQEKLVKLTLSREIGKKSTKSNYWSHECPSCGAPYKNTYSINCSYCNEKTNVTKYDWVVTNINDC